MGHGWFSRMHVNSGRRRYQAARTKNIGNHSTSVAWIPAQRGIGSYMKKKSQMVVEFSCTCCAVCISAGGIERQAEKSNTSLAIVLGLSKVIFYFHSLVLPHRCVRESITRAVPLRIRTGASWGKSSKMHDGESA